MQEIVTYSLRNGSEDSEKYYTDIAAFTDEMLKMAESLSTEEIMGFMRFNETIPGYTKEECVLEFLMLGTFWLVYSDEALALEGMPGRLLTELSVLRNKSHILKPRLDLLRGILATLYLASEDYTDQIISKPSMPNFEKLLVWLAASGDFRYEVNRLKFWEDFFKTLPEEEINHVIATAVAFAGWFEVKSREVLGGYTKNVVEFIKKEHPKRKWREDFVLCGRRRIEYHLNMVGAEIMNRVFRKDFLATKRKVLVLPGCMKYHQGNRCKARHVSPGMICVGCEKDCAVGKLNEIGKNLGFDVVIIPHGSDMEKKNEGKPAFEANTGVIGVSCVLSLLSGGWMLKEMGIPAQCVLLDFCGCKSHWHDTGIPTEINVKQLKKIFSVDI